MVFASVTAHGAIGDGVADDTAAFQTSINLGNILVPPGTYLVSSQITIPSNRAIKLLPGAVMKRKAQTGRQNSANPDNANFWTNSDIVNGNENITIEGGVYDGDQANQPTMVWSTPGKYCGSVAMRFCSVTHLSIRDVTIQNCLGFHIQLGKVNHFEVSGIRFFFSGNQTHQDGVHVNGPASNGVIRNIYSSGGNDDLVALNANDDGFGLMSEGHIDNILVDTVFSNGYNINPYAGSGFRLLNSSYNITNVTARNFHGCFQAGGVVTMAAAEGYGGGYVDNIIVEDFDVETWASNDPFCTYSIVGKTVMFHNCRWKAGNNSADNSVNSQHFLEGTGGSIETCIMSGIQIVDFPNNGNAPFSFGCSVKNLLLQSIIFNTLSGTQNYLIDFGDTPHVTNFVLNGAILNNVATLFHGDTVTGNKVVNAVLTNPAI